jgi:hypothetical protein
MALKKNSEDNLNYKNKKEEIQKVANNNPKVFDIGKILLLKRLRDKGDFKSIKKLKGPMYDYLTPAERRLLKKGSKE